MLPWNHHLLFILFLWTICCKKYHTKGECSLQVSSPFGDIVKSRRARGSSCSCILARLASLAQIGELACKLTWMMTRLFSGSKGVHRWQVCWRGRCCQRSARQWKAKANVTGGRSLVIHGLWSGFWKPSTTHIELLYISISFVLNAQLKKNGRLWLWIAPMLSIKIIHHLWRIVSLLFFNPSVRKQNPQKLHIW